MSKAQHTPGPWHVSETNNLGVRIYSGADHHENKSCHLIATAAYFREVSVQVANARLIAAAPDLLAALEAQQSAEAYAIQYRHLPDAMGDIADAFEQAQELRRAALAKAKGE